MKYQVIKAENLEWFNEFEGEERAKFRLLFPSGIVLNKRNLRIACVSWCDYSMKHVFGHFLDKQTKKQMYKEIDNVAFWHSKQSAKYQGAPWDSAEPEEAEVFYELKQTVEILYKYVPKLKIK